MEQAGPGGYPHVIRCHCRGSTTPPGQWLTVQERAAARWAGLGRGEAPGAVRKAAVLGALVR